MVRAQVKQFFRAFSKSGTAKTLTLYRRLKFVNRVLVSSANEIGLDFPLILFINRLRKEGKVKDLKLVLMEHHIL